MQANGLTMSDPTWDTNDSSGMGVCYGESYEPNAPDLGSYKVAIATLSPLTANYVWAGGGAGGDWTVHSFWWNDQGKQTGDDRMGFICDFEAKYTPSLGIYWDPNHANPAYQNKYLLRHGGMGSPTDVDTGVTRSAGWHHALIAGITVDLGGAPFNVYFQVLAVFIDGVRVVLLQESDGTLDTPDSGRWGFYYDETVGGTGVGYNDFPCYFDSMKHWAGLRYPNHVEAEFPVARPKSIQAITSLSISVDTAGQDIGGQCFLYFAVSNDSGQTYGTRQVLNLANLQAVVWAGRGRDVIKLSAIMLCNVGGINGIFSPRINKIEIGYYGDWTELDTPVGVFTEMVSPS